MAKFQLYELYILPPSEGSNFSHAVVAYRLEKEHNANDGKTDDISGLSHCSFPLHGRKLCFMCLIFFGYSKFSFYFDYEKHCLCPSLQSFSIHFQGFLFCPPVCAFKTWAMLGV